MKNLSSNKALKYLVLLSLTLGLAPFVPEPHILGKLRWLFGGGEGMQPMDYFDLVLHGTPWLLLLIGTSIRLLVRLKLLS